MLHTPRRLLLVALVVLATGGRSNGQAVFDSGAAETLSSPTGDPAVNVVVRDSAGGAPTTLEITTGAVIGEDPDEVSIAVEGGSAVTVSGGSASGALVVGDAAQAMLTGGVIEGNLELDGEGLVTLSTASLNDVEVSGNGLFRMLPGGEIGDDAEFFDNSRLEMSGGVFPDELQFFGNSTALITGGAVGDDIVVEDNAAIIIRDVELDDTIEAAVNAKIDISGGSFGAIEGVGREEIIEDGTRLELRISGGTFGPVTLFSPDLDATDVTVDITGGTFEEGLAIGGAGAVGEVSGATFEASDERELLARNLGVLDVNGANGTELDASATIGGELNLNDVTAETLNVFSLGGNANVNGGAAETLIITADRGEATLRGGDFDTIVLNSTFAGVLTVEGTEVLLNGQPFAGGEIAPASGALSGLLRDGSPFEATFTRQIDPAVRIATIRVAVVPEPTCLMITAVGVMAGGGVARRRRG